MSDNRIFRRCATSAIRLPKALLLTPLCLGLYACSGGSSTDNSPSPGTDNSPEMPVSGQSLGDTPSTPTNDTPVSEPPISVNPTTNPADAGMQLGPLPEPPLTPPPGPDSEPEPVTGQVSTVTQYFVVRDPAGRIPLDEEDLISEADFAAGPLPAVITVPPGTDPSNTPPEFLNLADQTVFAGSTMQLRLQPVDADGDLPGMFPGTLPEGSRYVDNFDGTRSLIWRPLQPDVGILEFTITAVDAREPGLRTERTVRIKVELPSDPSTIVNLPPSVNRVRPHTVRVNDPVVIEIKGSDPNGTIPNLGLTNPPPGATFEAHYNDPAIRVLRFVPDAPGPVQINVIARDAIDNNLSGEQTITIDVRDPADFIRPGERLRRLAQSRDLLIGYASLLDFYYRPDGALYADVARDEFNFVSTENSLKWDLVNPLPGRYRWAGTDNLLSYARLNGQLVHGHTLVWHRQLPGWIRRSEPSDREGHMREFIDRVVSRYGNRIPIWDVVNEAFEDDGQFRQSVWFEAMGESFIETAFRQARASAPNAILLYNDYDVAYGTAKPDAMFRMLQGLKDRNTPIDGVGFQMHVFADFDQFDEVASNFQRAANLDLDIYITELDVSMVGDDTEADQARVYERILSLCLEQPRCRAVQTWGFTDMYSWRSDFRPLLLDEAYQPKPAYFAIQQRLSEN